MVRGDQSGIFADPAPCFISQEEESILSAQERVRNISYSVLITCVYRMFLLDIAYVVHACISFLQERLAQLLADSLDVLESEDTLELLVAVCRSDQDESKLSFSATCASSRQGLAHLLDRVADHYSISPLPYSKASNSTESDSDSGFVSPASVALPLARFSKHHCEQYHPHFC